MTIRMQHLTPAAIAVVLVVAGIGIASTRDRTPADGPNPPAHRHADETLVRLEDYARAATVGVTQKPAVAEVLPDVDTMIARLAARLASAPDDVKGWRMLGWSYFNTGRFEDAAVAYRKAAELDPGSAELKRFYEDAKSKAAPPPTPAADLEERE